jgi:hypothetical protein
MSCTYNFVFSALALWWPSRESDQTDSMTQYTLSSNASSHQIPTQNHHSFKNNRAEGKYTGDGWRTWLEEHKASPNLRWRECLIPYARQTLDILTSRPDIEVSIKHFVFSVLAHNN